VWEKFTVAAAPSGSSIPAGLLAPASALPFTLPQVQVYVYSGTYTVNSATAPTTGCFYLFTTLGGAAIAGTAIPYSALAAGFPNESSLAFTVANTTTGSFTALSLSLNGSGTGSGAFSLSSGDSGSITINGRTMVQSPTTLAIRRSL
jgi:hypothetical protein